MATILFEEYGTSARLTVLGNFLRALKSKPAIVEVKHKDWCNQLSGCGIAYCDCGASENSHPKSKPATSTADDTEAQRRSWLRGEMAMGESVAGTKPWTRDFDTIGALNRIAAALAQKEKEDAMSINVLPDGSAFCVGVIGNRPYEDPATCLELAPDGQPKFWHSTNAAIWAAAFMQTFGDKMNTVDEGTMIGWFANAMMRMADGPTAHTRLGGK